MYSHAHAHIIDRNIVFSVIFNAIISFAIITFCFSINISTKFLFCFFLLNTHQKLHCLSDQMNNAIYLGKWINKHKQIESFHVQLTHTLSETRMSIYKHDYVSKLRY